MLKNYKLKIYLSVLLIGLLTVLRSYSLTFPMPAPGNDIVGKVEIVEVSAGDTLTSIGSRYGIGFQEMREANPTIYPQMRLVPGDKVIVPTQFILPSIRQGIVINLAELRLYYFLPDSKEVMTFPIAIGRSNWQTPVMETRIIGKQEDPAWYVPKSIQEYVLKKKGEVLPDVVPPGPHNPLGKYKIQLARPGYLLHGTNVPSSIGKRVSSGCIRLPANGIEALYHLVELNTPVYIINQPIKAGWLDRTFYIESHWPLSDYPAPSDKDGNSLDWIIERALNGLQAMLDWQKVTHVVEDKIGIPYAVGSKF